MVPNIWLTRPSLVASSRSDRLEMITQLRKCGRYSTVCATRLNFGNASSLSSSAIRMGIGVPITRSSRFRMMVFFSASIKFLSLNALMNHSQPPFFAQSSSHGAFRMLFFLNASRM